MQLTKHKFSRINEIINLVAEQEPERTDIIKALKKCSCGRWTSTGYYKFYLASKEPGRFPLKFKENIILQHQRFGFIVLDVYTNGSIAGIEFMNLIEE
jgi:hypothetical protein